MLPNLPQSSVVEEWVVGDDHAPYPRSRFSPSKIMQLVHRYLQLVRNRSRPTPIKQRSQRWLVERFVQRSGEITSFRRFPAATASALMAPLRVRSQHQGIFGPYGNCSVSVASCSRQRFANSDVLFAHNFVRQKSLGAKCGPPNTIPIGSYFAEIPTFATLRPFAWVSRADDYPRALTEFPFRFGVEPALGTIPKVTLTSGFTATPSS
jgi:hypothetical protein